MSARLALPSLLLAAALIACGDGGGSTSDPGSTGEAGSTSDPSGTSGTLGTTGDTRVTGGPETTSDAPTGTTADHDATTTTTTDPTTTTTATGDPGTSESSDTGVVEELPPIESTELLEAWLAEGSYLTWASESGVHASTGPHGGNVRTFVNAIALASLAAENPEHPTDAATVKELYGDSMDEIIGYAVTRKTAAESQGGDTWYWYERIDATIYADKLGVGLCTSCHGDGADYILTPFPLQ